MVKIPVKTTKKVVSYISETINKTIKPENT